MVKKEHKVKKLSQEKVHKNKFNHKKFSLKIFFLTLGIEIFVFLALIIFGLWNIVAIWDKVFLILLALLLLYLFSFRKA